MLEGATIGGKPVRAAADLGASISLISLDACRALGVKFNYSFQPTICPSFGTYTFRCRGITLAKVHTPETGLTRRIMFGVVDNLAGTQALVGHKDLAKLGLVLGPAPPTPNLEQLAIAPAPALTPDPPVAAPDLPTVMPELRAAPEPPAAIRPSPLDSETGSNIQYREVVKKIGLPAGYFCEIDRATDEDWKICDAMYPAVDAANIAARIIHQAPNEQAYELLMSELMSAAPALCEYPSGCPPPAAIEPIMVPMNEDAEPLFIAT
ncbi:hypothetical protein FBU31_003911 [Coemansia sp. 'formosensis']|nr:hypothetical protein FBU31_003911 [Coemansia sp. 'formosensis']